MCSQPLPTDKRYIERLQVAFNRQKSQGMDVTVTNSRDPVSALRVCFGPFPCKGVRRRLSSLLAFVSSAADASMFLTDMFLFGLKPPVVPFSLLFVCVCCSFGVCCAS